MPIKRITALILSFLFITSCSKPLDKLQQQKINAKQDQKLSVNNPKTPRKNTVVSLPKGDFILGDKDAPLDVVAFVDYSCASCARIDRVVRRLLADPELKKIIHLSYRQYPLRTSSVKPAKVALAAALQGNEKFWLMSQKLFSADGDLKDENYLLWAREVGLDVNKFARDLVEKEPSFAKTIARDTAMTVQIKRAGSPIGIFVGGFLFRASVTFENLKAFIGAVKAHREKSQTKTQVAAQ